MTLQSLRFGTVPKITRESIKIAGKKTVERQTPYMVTDLTAVDKNVAAFKKALPEVDIYYAIKANRDEQVIKTVDNDVSGYDIASLGELELLMAQGISADRVIYSNPVKIPHHIQRAYELGVRYFAFDSTSEIKKLAQYAPGSTVYLRIKVADYGSKFPLSKKFGVDPMHAVDLCSLAQDSGLEVKGITFHVGSQSENIEVWKTAIKIAGKTISDLKNKGLDIEFLDLGGGFPADYGEAAPTITQVAKAIHEGIAKYLDPQIRLIAEPGRYVVANSSHFVTSVICRENRSGSDWLYLDIGTFQGLIEPLEMSNWKYPVKTDKGTKGYHKEFVLSGPTCDAFDTIGTDYMLPSDLDVGDKLYIGAVGAYSTVYASDFNGFPIPKTYYVKSEDK
jgi:ornithine decarboxylase